MVHIHLNWCLEGCTEWRWMRGNLVQVLDRRIERERQAMFWHTWLENHLSEFSISEEKAACHPLCTSKKAQGWIWSVSVYVGCKSHLSRKKIAGKRFFFVFFSLIRWFSERALNNKFRHPRVCFPILVYKRESLGYIFFLPHHTRCDLSVMFCKTWLTSAPLGWGDYRWKSPLKLLSLCLKSMPWTARRDW